MGAIFLYRMAVHIFMPVIISWMKPESLVLLLLQIKKRCSQVLPPLSNILKRQYVLLRKDIIFLHILERLNQFRILRDAIKDLEIGIFLIGQITSSSPGFFQPLVIQHILEIGWIFEKFSD